MADLEEYRRLWNELDDALTEQRALLPPARELRPGQPIVPHQIDQAWIDRWERAKARRAAAEASLESWWRRSRPQ